MELLLAPETRAGWLREPQGTAWCGAAAPSSVLGCRGMNAHEGVGAVQPPGILGQSRGAKMQANSSAAAASSHRIAGAAARRWSRRLCSSSSVRSCSRSSCIALELRISNCSSFTSRVLPEQPQQQQSALLKGSLGTNSPWSSSALSKHQAVAASQQLTAQTAAGCAVVCDGVGAGSVLHAAPRCAVRAAPQVTRVGGPDWRRLSVGLWLGVATCSCLDLSNTDKPPSTGPDTLPVALQTRAEQHLRCRGLAAAAAVPGGWDGI